MIYLLVGITIQSADVPQVTILISLFYETCALYDVYLTIG